MGLYFLVFIDIVLDYSPNFECDGLGPWLRKKTATRLDPLGDLANSLLGEEVYRPLVLFSSFLFVF